MTLTELKYVVTLAKEQHFGRAAELCNVSQPTLSIGVKKLEEELGAQLFERAKSSVKPTPLGVLIVEKATRVLSQIREIKETAEANAHQLSSPLRIGAIYTIGPYLFPHLIPLLHESAPDMPLIIEENYTSVLRRRLVAGDLDAIIISLPFTEADVVTQPIYDESFHVLMHRDHPLAELPYISEQDLAEHNLLMLGEGHCFRDQILDVSPHLSQLLQSSEQKSLTAAEGSSLETLRHMVASNFGITLLPESAASTKFYTNDALITRPYMKQPPVRTVALAWRASYPRDSAIDKLRAAIKQSAVTAKLWQQP